MVGYRAGHDYEAAALAALEDDAPAPALVQHTSAALPAQYDAFVAELETHLPAYSRPSGGSCPVALAFAMLFKRTTPTVRRRENYRKRFPSLRVLVARSSFVRPRAGTTRAAGARRSSRARARR